MTNLSKSSISEKFISLAQTCLSKTPVIVLGSGASAQFNIPGMTELLQNLQKNIDINGCSDEEKKSWTAFLTLSGKKGLEGALTDIQLPAHLNQQIIEHTWELINNADLTVFQRLVADQICLPLTKLIKFLFKSTHPTIHLVTTNYDRLAEYAINKAGFPYFNGFQSGYLQSWDPEYMPHKYLFDRRLCDLRKVCLWKVHGSIDWFTNSSENPIALPNITSILMGTKPLIITPGSQKYEGTHYEPFRTLLSQADNALKNAQALLCVGYGFNDKHIQPKLEENCSQRSTLIVVLAQKLTDAAKIFLLHGKCKNFLAFEESSLGTRVYSPEYTDGYEMEDTNLWDFDKFIQYTLPE